MATQYGHIAAFQQESESIKTYLERVQLYFQANKVPEDLQVPVLVSSIGAPTYSLLSDLLAPHAPGSKSLREISEVLRSHFEPKWVVIAQRFYFHKHDQAAGESIADYDASLGNIWRRLSAIVLCVALGMKPFSAACSQRWILPMLRQWRSPVAWRRPTGIPKPSKAQSQCLGNSTAIVVRARVPR